MIPTGDGFTLHLAIPQQVLVVRIDVQLMFLRGKFSMDHVAVSRNVPTGYRRIVSYVLWAAKDFIFHSIDVLFQAGFSPRSLRRYFGSLRQHRLSSAKELIA